MDININEIERVSQGISLGERRRNDVSKQYDLTALRELYEDDNDFTAWLFNSNEGDAYSLGEHLYMTIVDEEDFSRQNAAEFFEWLPLEDPKYENDAFFIEGLIMGLLDAEPAGYTIAPSDINVVAMQ